jgi:hypothetical protein
MRPTPPPLAPLRETHPGQTLAQAMGYSREYLAKAIVSAVAYSSALENQPVLEKDQLEAIRNLIGEENRPVAKK